MKETLEDKKRERDKYIQLVDSDIKNMDFDINAHKKYVKFIVGTVALGFFYMWCSSNEESNFFRLLNENTLFIYFFATVPYVLIILFLFFVLKSAIARKGKIDLSFYQEYTFQKKIFGKFLMKKMGYNEDIEIAKIIDKYKICKDDITFDYYEFRNYVKDFIEKRYKFDYPELFFEHLTWLILYNEEVRGTLIKESDYDFIFIVERNIDFIMHIY